MRRFITSLPLLFLASFSSAKATKIQEGLDSKGYYDFSGGIDTYHSSLALQDNVLANGLNIYVGDANAPITKRQGYTVAFSTKSYQFKNAWSYTDGNSVSWIIVRTSDSIVANQLTNSASVLIATVTTNTSVAETNAQGNAYFVDQVDGVFYWNGTATTYVSASPKGSLITTFHNRVWVAGLAIPNGNQLYGSKQNDGTTWTAGINPNDPVQLTVGLNDNYDTLTALYPFLDTMYTFKHYSTYGLYGFDQTSFQSSIITQECGCIDSNSIQTYNHGLNFVSERGIEFFDGYTCTRISDAIKNLVDPSIATSGFSQQTWTLSQTSDWTSGTLVQLDTTDFSPSLSLVNVSTNIANNSFETGSFTGWTAGADWSVVSTNLGQFCQDKPFKGSYFAMATNPNANVFNGHIVDGLSAEVVYSTSTSTLISSTSFSVSTISGQCVWQDSNFHGFSLPIPAGLSVSFIVTDGQGSTLASNAFVSNGTPLTFYATINSASSNFPGPNTSYFNIDFISPNIALNTIYSSGTFISPVHSIPAITSWGNFLTNTTLTTGGAIEFKICTSSAATMVTSTCTFNSGNNQITNTPVNSFVQWTATFTLTNIITDTATLTAGSINWFTGNPAAPMASTVWDNRYWLSLTTSPVDSANDAIVVLNKKGAFSIFDIHAGGLTLFKGNLYHTDSRSTGNIYLDNQGYNDNGAAINAFVQTKDYTQGDLTEDDYFDSIYPSMDNMGNFNMEISYYMDRLYSSPFSLSSVNETEFSANSAVKVPFPISGGNQNFGKVIAYLFTANDQNQPWNFYGFTHYFHTRPPQ